MDLFMTQTAKLSDIVLPAASCFEKTELTAYPSVRTNFVLLQQRVIEPIGESWPDWKLWFELGKKMGFQKEFPWEDIEQALDEQLKPSGLTVADLKEKPVILPKRYHKFKENGFPQVASGKVQLYSELLQRYGFEPLPTYVEPPESPISKPELLSRYPLMAICWPRSIYVHTQFRNVPWLRHLDPEPLVRIHPNDAEERSIKNGDKVVVRSLRGSINTKATITERVPRGTAALSWGWGEAVPEAGLNRLTDDVTRNRIAGSTSNRLFLCEVEKA
jgi:anaerobic selenocysteine-containing dehydrogenase